MKTAYTQNHFRDTNGAPEGGQSFGPGFAIAWQRGPLGRDDNRIEPNGAFVETVLDAVAGRIEEYQSSKFANDYNARALNHIYAALDSLNQRTIDRESRKVEGTHKL